MNWNDALVVLDVGVAEVFDRETFHVRPMSRIDVNKAPVADVERVIFDFSGSIDFGPMPLLGGYQHPLSLAGPASRSGRDAAASHEAVVTAYRAAWPYEIRVGDQLEWNNRRLIVAARDGDGTDRVALYVNSVKVCL